MSKSTKPSKTAKPQLSVVQEHKQKPASIVSQTITDRNVYNHPQINLASSRREILRNLPLGTNPMDT
jgi:hypothetical protein